MFCSDINECSGSHSCNFAQSYCHDTSGSYECHCNAGYVRNGASCTSKSREQVDLNWQKSTWRKLHVLYFWRWKTLHSAHSWYSISPPGSQSCCSKKKTTFSSFSNVDLKWWQTQRCLVMHNTDDNGTLGTSARLGVSVEELYQVLTAGLFQAIAIGAHQSQCR